jgi:hypothetical protein
METSLVAWYGALLSSAVLTWDLAKWWRAEPRLRITAKRDVAYTDAEQMEEVQEADGTKFGILATYCHVEIVNTGGRATTLITVEAFSQGKNKGEMFVGSTNFKIHRGSEQLPAKLGPGEMWSARLDMRQLEGMEKFGAVSIRARAAYREKPIESPIRGRAEPVGQS